MQTIQKTFSPIDYGFAWTDDGWYEWDSKAARVAARKARDEEAKRLRKSGWNVKVYAIQNQLISKGGIGSGHPHIEAVVSVYMIDASRLEFGSAAWRKNVEKDTQLSYQVKQALLQAVSAAK